MSTLRSQLTRLLRPASSLSSTKSIDSTAAISRAVWLNATSTVSRHLTTGAEALKRQQHDIESLLDDDDTTFVHTARSATPNATPTSTQSTSSADAAASSSSTTAAPGVGPDDLPMNDKLRTALKRNFNIDKLYPIQAEAYTPITEGRDVIARSRTGTGKTLAFVLPIVERLLRANEAPIPGSCKVVIMEPTRELAKQVADEIKKLSKQVSIVTIYGGAPYAEQEHALRRGVDIVIATPGRMIDHINRGNVNLNHVMTAVLDESDEMLRMGFVQPIEEIFGHMKAVEDRQTLLFSATLPRWVQGIAKKFQSNPLMIDKVTGEENKSSLTVSHRCMVAPFNIAEKAAIIGHLVQQFSTQRAIVFVQRKSEADDIANSMELGVEARALHGDVAQSRREKIMADFKSGKFRVLVATDVAARGVDIPSVELVIQSSMPDEAESYIHRSGRTGRAGRSGTSVILHTPDQRRDITAFSRAIGAPIEPIYTSSVGRMDEEEVQKAMEQAESHISQHRRQANAFADMAQKLLDKHNTTALAAFLSKIYGNNMAPRSMLTSQINRSTVAVKLPKRLFGDERTEAKNRIAAVLDVHSVPTYASETIDGVVYIDLPSEHALNLLQKIEASETEGFDDVFIPTELPKSLFAPAAFNKRSGGGSFGGRARSYESTFEDRPRGRSGGRDSGRSFGGGDRGFGGGERFGDRRERSSSGSRFGGREDRFGGERSDSGDRSERRGGRSDDFRPSNSKFGQGGRGKSRY